MAGDDSKPPSPPIYRIHPATTITNIKNHIPLVLGTEERNYNNWVALFKVQCTVCKVLDHIIPPDAAPSEHDEEWLCLDAIVLQWIYSTITTDLLTTILHPDNTAHKAWQALQGIFVDNKPTRAIYLQQKFSNTKLAAFPDATAYCRELKLLSDQRTFCPLLRAARTALLMEESRKAQQQPTAAIHADVVQPTAAAPEQPADISNRFNQRGADSYRGRVRGGRHRGRGRGRGRNNFYVPGNNSTGPRYPPQQPWPYQPWGYSHPSWAAPPCPYPTMPKLRPPGQNPGILGFCPSANYAAYTPTNIEQALHTMTLNPYQNWYMDTGATNHMTHSAGILKSYVNNGTKSIPVGNGSKMQTTGVGHTTLPLPPPYPPLYLPNILVSPSLIKNLLSVPKLGTVTF
ncbi:hypothetical protein OSB04_011986 [Centaurea solstitialis]|uniref:Retrovirus-related Pol polyprotein from transposon TNT 1-94-like beta-barrel domain-containing protein n=1 Tax=Centaurea solstitialis TaxID=347529 RepID=A0AA38WE71_9ASTR|nr:hypothetical protein OSB04_011986 [Centaurea solstitialis]